MKLYPNSKVYILCPRNLQTGGPESLHQLASQLISFGVETYMVYTTLADNPFNPEDSVHDAYKKYHVPYIMNINMQEDNSKNVVIIPETITFALYALKNFRHVIWWMSVDNYLSNIIKTIELFLKNPLVEPVRRLFTFYDADKDIEHWFKSEYARQFLELNGIKKMHYVESYMSQTFLNQAAQIDLSAKKNLVAYNPKKGFEITQQLINAAPDIDWRPIINMTPAQVQELLAQAKIYIDFGEHPGKDRLPREATISKCVVIVGKRGAAANDVDYNIPDEFKFTLSDSKPCQVIEKIHEVFENFESELDKQKAFREKELNAKKNFAAQIIEAFEIKNLPPTSVAFAQGFGEKIFVLTQKFSGNKDFALNFIIDDEYASATISDILVWRDQNRNYLLGEENPAEIITRDDAKFLYLEGRIKKFALLEPTDAELDELKNFYAPNDSDILIFNR